VQNAIKAETLPELIADVDRPGFTMLLGRDPSWIVSGLSSALCRCRVDV